MPALGFVAVEVVEASLELPFEGRSWADIKVTGIGQSEIPHPRVAARSLKIEEWVIYDGSFFLARTS